MSEAIMWMNAIKLMDLKDLFVQDTKQKSNVFHDHLTSQSNLDTSVSDIPLVCGIQSVRIKNIENYY